MQNIENVKTFARAVLDNKNLESQAKENGKTAASALMYHAALAYRNDIKETLEHIEANLEKTGSYYAIRGMFSKAKRVGKSDKVFTETTSISALYAEILAEEKAANTPKDAERAAKKAIMDSLKMDAKAWNSLTHKEQGELLEQGEKIVAAQASEDKQVLILDRAEVKALILAYIEVNGFDGMQDLLSEIEAETLAKAA